MAYIGKSPTGTGVRSRFYYTQSSGGGTSISGTDDNSKTLTFTDGEYIDVFLNGVLLVAGTDYNTTTANTVGGLAALASGDVVEVVVYDVFTVADTVSASQGGTFQGNVVFNGTTTGLDLNGTELVLDADADTSITADTDDQIDFKTGGSDRVVIDASGRVGIGTTDPDTYGDSNTKLAVVTPTSNANDVNIRFGTNDVKGIIFVNDVSGDGVGFGTTTGDHVQFNTNNAERMRIDSSGNIGIGTTTLTGSGTPDSTNDGVGVRILPNGFLGIGRQDGLCCQFNRSNDGQIIRFRRGGTEVGSIGVDSSSTSFNTSSDHRLKENVADMTGAIARVKQLAPKRFNFIADATDTLVDGFLAHEAQTVVPEAVMGTHNEVDDDGNAVMQGIDQSKLVPLLTGALKEAIAKIETLETKVAALENAE